MEENKRNDFVENEIKRLNNDSILTALPLETQTAELARIAMLINKIRERVNSYVIN